MGSLSSNLSSLHRLLLSGVAACVLSFSIGCATALPEPEPMAMGPLPDAFAMNGDAPLSSFWWTAFDNAELNGWVERALSEQPSLMAVWDRLAQAEAVAIKQGAGRFPSLEAQAGASRAARHSEEGGESVAGTTYATEYSAGLLASYELDIWGRVRATRNAALLDVAVTAEQVQTSAITLSAETTLAWLRAVEQQGQIELLEKQLTINEQILDVLQQRFRRGQGNAVDVIQQEQLVETRRGDLATARSRAAVLRNQLALLTGQSVMALPEFTTRELPGLPSLPAAGVPSEILHRRPDVRQAFYQVHAADRRSAAAVADRFPRISLTARASTTAPSAGDLFDNWLANLAANLASPLIDGGSRRAEVERTRAAVSEALHTYRRALLQAVTEIENALVQESEQQKLIVSLDRQQNLSRAAIERLRDQYLNGTEDFLRVLNSELVDQALERSRLQAERELLEYRVALYRAMAGALPLDRPDPIAFPVKELSP